MNKNQNDYILITTQEELDKYLQQIKDEKILFIDTEFHSERMYFSELCLIQIATKDTLAAIDPLINKLNLTNFINFLNNEEILKVFHAGRQDLEIFYKLNNNQPIKNIFDTQIAALALGLGEQIGYANLVKSILNINIDKSQQVANWIHRPLSKEQLKYALEDVIYLKKIYYKIIKKMERKGRINLIKDELKKLEEESTFSPNYDALIRKVKVKDHSALTQSILKKLIIFREKEAQTLNKPRTSIIRDEFLGFCARLKPTTHEELESVRGVTKKILNKYSDTITDIINKTINSPLEELDHIEERTSPSVDSSLKNLAKFLLQLKAKEHSISLKLVTDDSDLRMFLTKPKYPSKLRSSWRWDLFGKDLELLRQGNLFIGVKNKKVILKKIENKEKPKEENQEE